MLEGFSSGDGGGDTDTPSGEDKDNDEEGQAHPSDHHLCAHSFDQNERQMKKPQDPVNWLSNMFTCQIFPNDQELDLLHS